MDKKKTENCIEMKLGVEFSFRIFFIQEWKINLFHILNLFMVELKKKRIIEILFYVSYIFRVLLYQLPETILFKKKKKKIRKIITI